MKPILPILLTLCTLSCKAQPAHKFNLDFETYQPGQELADGWLKWGDYALSTDTTRQSGKWAAKIISAPNGGSFGCIAYKIPANYKGKNIRLEGYMKIENVEHGFAGLLLRLDGNGGTLAFDNMQSQNVNGTKDWVKYTIDLAYPEDAETIFVAGILAGKGTAWFDDFVLTIDGENVQTLKETARPVIKATLDKEFDSDSKIGFPELNATVIANLELLGRVWGFLKYCHPEAGSGNYNWDYELFRMLPEFLKAEKGPECDRILIKWIDQYGKIGKCKTCKTTPPDAPLKPDLSWIDSDDILPELKTKLMEIYRNRRQDKNHYIRMAPNIGNPEFLNENPYADMPYPDAGFRLLALYKYWNMIQYFFPYKHLMDKNWNGALREYIPLFIRAKNELEYELAAVRIIGDIQDTHANLWGGGDKINEEKGGFYPPFHVRFIEGKLVVTDYYNPELREVAGLEIGDVITHLNGKTVENLTDSLSGYYPASNMAARLRDISGDILRSKTPRINIQFISTGAQQQKELALYPRDSLNIYRWYRRDNEKCYQLLDGNIGYVTLKSIKEEDIPIIKESFKNTKGIIIDIRNYPSTFVPFLLGSFFVAETTPFVKFTGGNVDHPGEFTFTEALQIPKGPETYTGKLVVIVNELSQSQAEYTAMAFRAGANTTIIGSTTAGADGNVSTILLPGGLRTMISGIGVYYPDGTETQRVGIVPDIEVHPTIEGIKAGRDELLEKALEIIRQ